MPRVALATDDFNRADSNDLGANYAESAGATPIRIISNTLRTGAIAGSSELNRYTGVTFSADQYLKLTLVTQTNFIRAGVGVRLSGSAGVITGYVAVVETHINDRLELVKCIGQALVDGTVLGTATLPASGQLVEVEVSGTTIKVFVGGVQVISVADAAVASGEPGFATYNTGTPDEHHWDNLEVGNVTPGGGGPGFFAPGPRPRQPRRRGPTTLPRRDVLDEKKIIRV